MAQGAAASEWRGSQRFGCAHDGRDSATFGGHAAAAPLAGRFRASAGGQTVIEVGVGVGYDAADRSTTCSSKRFRRFIIGLPNEFADGVVDGLLSGGLLPAGVPTIDRAGFSEMDSSTFAFRQTAALFVAAIAARLAGEGAEDAAHDVVTSW